MVKKASAVKGGQENAITTAQVEDLGLWRQGGEEGNDFWRQTRPGGAKGQSDLVIGLHNPGGNVFHDQFNFKGIKQILTARVLNNLFSLCHPERSRGIPPLACTLGRDDKVELFNTLNSGSGIIIGMTERKSGTVQDTGLNDGKPSERFSVGTVKAIRIKNFVTGVEVEAGRVRIDEGGIMVWFPGEYLA